MHSICGIQMDVFMRAEELEETASSLRDKRSNSIIGCDANTEPREVSWFQKFHVLVVRSNGLVALSSGTVLGQCRTLQFCPRAECDKWCRRCPLNCQEQVEE